MPPFCATAPTALIPMYVKLKRWQTRNENTSKEWIFFFSFFSGGARWWPWHHSELVIYWSEGHYAGFERWEGLWRCADRVAVCGGMGSICISVWDPDSSGFSLHPDLLHACLTVYCPPPPPLTPPSPHIYHFRRGPHAHTWHTQIQTRVCTHKSRG